MGILKTHGTVRKIVAFFCASLVGILFTYINNQNYSQLDVKNNENYSSVWCKIGFKNSKICRFRNLCYYPSLKSFLFFLNNKSVIKGLDYYNELQTIQLSSINSHNNFFANVSVVVTHNYHTNFEVSIKKGLLFSRFKPDNIMHVIHDDLIPLFLTLEEICLGNFKLCEMDYRIVIHDNYPMGPYFNLYELFTVLKPVILTKLSNNDVICFEELHAGLIQDSLFYQYGFQDIQGPVNNSKLVVTDLIRFGGYIKNKLNISVNNENKTNILLINRKQSRRILNKGDLIKMLKTAYENSNSYKDSRVISLDLSEAKVENVLQKLTGAAIFVAMHGAEMIFSIFLEPNSTVVELFPYGIQEDAVSFIKPLTKLKGIYFHYITWKNKHKRNSVFHPEADKLHGGINFLPQDLQEKIKAINKVPAVHCCNNPIYLYFMYQDIWVEPDFEEFLMQSLQNISKKNLTPSYVQNDWLFPSPVSNVSCFYDPRQMSINISWKAPFNIIPQNLMYDVLLSESSHNFHKNFITNVTKFDIKLPQPAIGRNLKVWISAINEVNNAKSEDTFFECS